MKIALRKIRLGVIQALCEVVLSWENVELYPAPPVFWNDRVGENRELVLSLWGSIVRRQDLYCK